MKWNWQRAAWPNFSYKSEDLDSLEDEFLRQAGLFLGTIKHIPAQDQAQLKVEFLTNEAVETSAIEGEILNRDSVQSSIRRQFGLPSPGKKIPPAEQGIAKMMVSLCKNFAAPLGQDQLFSWHRMLMEGRKGLDDVGKYRSHHDPMEIVSGPIHRQKVYFQAPPSKKVRGEMKAFIHWYNQTAPAAKEPLPALTRSGLTHLYFVSIHPFEDGNGRLARALSEKALSQALGQPTLIALSQTIEAQRKKYYEYLERNNKRLEVTEWLVYFAKTILSAQVLTQQWIDFLIDKTKLFERLRGQLNSRQAKTLERMFREGPEGFEGGLSAEKYIHLTKTSRATATRDLQDLVEMGALRKRGELKHTRYFLNVPAS